MNLKWYRFSNFFEVFSGRIMSLDEEGICVHVEDFEAPGQAEVSRLDENPPSDGVDLVEDGYVVEAVGEAAAEPVDADQHAFQSLLSLVAPSMLLTVLRVPFP
jgi:hypothetical protein